MPLSFIYFVKCLLSHCDFALILVQGVGEGSPPLPETATARTGEGSGRGRFFC